MKLLRLDFHSDDTYTLMIRDDDDKVVEHELVSFEDNNRYDLEQPDPRHRTILIRVKKK